MSGIKRILCPTDFSEPSRKALDHAVSMAKWYASEITVLHVSPVPSVSEPHLLAPGMLPMEPDAREHLREKLAGFAEPAAKAGIPLKLLLDEGPAVERILAGVEATGADLVVLGTHGASGFRRLVLGSVTESVLRKASCPVLTVSPLERTAASSEILFRTILCPVDFSETSAAALKYALSLADEARAHIIALHVIEEPPSEKRSRTIALGLDITERLSPTEAEARERLRAFVPAQAEPRSSLEQLVVSGKPAREILRLAEEREAGFIVMGVRGRGALDMMLFGSTTNHVVRAAACPVLTIPGSASAAQGRKSDVEQAVVA